MARKQSGGFNRFLNLIGLVDDTPPRESYSEEYDSAGYGRPSTYVPPRRSAAQPRPTARKSLPAQAGRSHSGAERTTYGVNDVPRRRRSYREEPETAFEPRTAPRSRFEEDDEAPERTELPEPIARPARGVSQRTVLASLNNLRDANRVITALVAGNMIVMTIATEDEGVRQRIIDTLSGAVFALGATIRKASEQTYVLAPRTVNVKSAYDVDDRF